MDDDEDDFEFLNLEYEDYKELKETCRAQSYRILLLEDEIQRLREFAYS